MTISIDESTQVITIEQSDLSLVSGALYEMDTNAYRLAVGALLDDERYIWMDPAFNHNGEVTVAGTTFFRVIEQTNGYSITFENLTYSVRLAGSNNNLFDVENGILNPSGNVTVISGNSAGNIVVETGTSGLTAAEATQLEELHKVYGLDSASPVTHRKDPAQIEFDAETIKLTEDVDGNVTAERQ